VLQGACLADARLQGASLGARLDAAQFERAQLQGASFEGAILEATGLANAYLWRTTPSSTVGTVLVAGVTWLPNWEDEHQSVRAWDDETYRDLQKTIESIPPGSHRDQARKRIQRLDCSRSDRTLASCTPSDELPPEAAAWRKVLEAEGPGVKAYRVALAGVLKGLICSYNGDDVVQALRGRAIQRLIFFAHEEASNLIGALTNDDRKACPVSASLTDADRAKLLQIRRGIEADEARQKSVPPSPPTSP
jgi:uncharacterized protein YjbI with pentapeptide repeats